MDLDDLWAVIRQIPPGRVASYGDVGRSLSPPLSGFLVGRRLRHAPDGVPWWRVVAQTGALPTHKLDPRIGADQRRRLEAEGVEFEEGRVAAPMFWVP